MLLSRRLSGVQPDHYRVYAEDLLVMTDITPFYFHRVYGYGAVDLCFRSDIPIVIFHLDGTFTTSRGSRGAAVRVASLVKRGSTSSL